MVLKFLGLSNDNDWQFHLVNNPNNGGLVCLFGDDESCPGVLGSVKTFFLPCIDDYGYALFGYTSTSKLVLSLVKATLSI